MWMYSARSSSPLLQSWSTRSGSRIAGNEGVGRMTRRGLVLGAGGVLGLAWTIGALAALEQTEGLTPGDFEVCVGTSAGSVLAAMLGCGISVDQMVRHQQGGRPRPDDPLIPFNYDRDSGGSLPPRPLLRLGSPKLALEVVRRPHRFPPL